MPSQVTLKLYFKECEDVLSNNTLIVSHFQNFVCIFFAQSHKFGMLNPGFNYPFVKNWPGPN